MAIRVNLAGVKAGKFDPIPAGSYICTIYSHEIKEASEKAKNPGSEYINWELVIQEGDHADRHLWAMTTLLPDNLASLKELLLASGRFSEEQLESPNGFDFEPEDVYGATVMAVVGIQKYQGEDRNNVRRIRPVSIDRAESLLP